MKQNDRIDMTLFSRYLRELGWPSAISALDAGDLVIADIEFLNVLARIVPNLKCEAVTPQNIENISFRSVKRILVFCRENEQALVRRLRARYPKKIIISGTYEYMLVGIKKSPVFLRARPGATKVADRVLVLASPGIEAEFLGRYFPALGLPVPREYFSRPLSLWLNEFSGFSPLRYVVNAERRFAVDGQFTHLLHADVLEKLFQKTSLTEEKFTQYLTASNYRVIRLTDPRVFRQAMMNGILHNTPIRSPWTSPVIYKNGKLKWNNPLVAVEGMKKIEKWNQMLDRVTGALPSILALDFMQVTSQVESSLSQMADYLGCNAVDAEKIEPYVDPVMENDSVATSISQMQRELVDRMGLYAGGKI